MCHPVQKTYLSKTWVSVPNINEGQHGDGHAANDIAWNYRGHNFEYGSTVRADDSVYVGGGKHEGATNNWLAQHTNALATMIIYIF